MQGEGNKESESWYELFLSVIVNAFKGNTVPLDHGNYRLPPTLVKPYDFSRKFVNPRNQYEAYLKALPPRFSQAASSEMYRKDRGWISRGIIEGRIRAFSIGKERYVAPRLSGRSVGIDTSTFNDKTVVAICIFADADAPNAYLEKHLSIPKAKNPEEFKWRKLDKNNHAKISQSFELLLKMSCEALLIIETDTIQRPPQKLKNIFSNILEGCFSGYERSEGTKRASLRRYFFDRINGTETHCDADFAPVPPTDIVRLLVQTLARRNNHTDPFRPVYVNLRSHESAVIQVADIFVGCIREKLAHDDPIEPLLPLKFDRRKIKAYKTRTARAFYYSESGVGSR